MLNNILIYFNRKQQVIPKATIFLISAFHYKYRKMAATCCVTKCVLKRLKLSAAAEMEFVWNNF